MFIHRIYSSMRFSTNGAKVQIFHRAFLFASKLYNNLPVGMAWVNVPFGSLAISDDYEYCSSVSAGVHSCGLIVVGNIIDINRPDSTTQELTRRLAELGAGSGSLDSILKMLEDCLGRYAIFTQIDGKQFIFNDACATRTIYYSNDFSLFASHSTIIGDLQGDQALTDFFKCYGFGLPGNQSIFPRVKVLFANFLLNIEAKKVTRFWPRLDRVERPVAHVLEEFSQCMTAGARAIAARWHPIVSVTAGLDSRCTLAAFRNVNNARFFTYFREGMDDVDVAVAKEACGRLNLQHRTIRMVGTSKDPETYEAVRLMHDYTHIRGASAAYMSAFDGDGQIHVRSNLGEIGRGFWRRLANTEQMDAERVAALVAKKAMRGTEHWDAAQAFALNEAQKMIDRLGYEDLDTSRPHLHGYDAWDLLYWEHRMSTWHAQVLLGSDFRFDTAILFNSRKVLSLMLNPPYEERRHSAILTEFVKKQTPEFDDLPINPKTFTAAAA